MLIKKKKKLDEAGERIKLRTEVNERYRVRW